MGQGYKDPPKFSQHQSYTRWKNQVEAWKEVAVANKFVSEDTVGQVLALSLPDSAEEGDIRGKVMDAIKAADLKGANGYTNLIKWMDDHMGRDDTTNTIDKIRDFMKYKRRDDQGVNDYIAGFDAKYHAAVNSGLDALPQAYLMWLIIENVEVSEQESKLIMSGVDLAKKTTLYTQAKESVIKYLAGPGSKMEHNSGIKLKNDTLFAKAGGWNKPKQYVPRYPMPQGGGGGGQRSGAGAGGGSGAGAYGGARPKTEVSIPMNPMKNGKRTLCDICGTWTHFKRDCPFNPRPAMYGDIPEGQEEGAPFHEDSEFAYVAQPTQPEMPEQPKHPMEYYPADYQVADTHINSISVEKKVDHVASMLAELSTNSNTKLDTFIVEVLITDMMNTLLVKDFNHPGQVVLDTGCIETVAATEWLNNFIQYLHPATRKLIKVEKSKRVFRFGGGEKRQSIGTFHIPCSLDGHNLILTVDAVEQPGLPCLLSKKAMKKAKTVLFLEDDTAEIWGKKVELKENQAGHYVTWFEDFVYKDGEVAVMWTNFNNKGEKEIEHDLKRIHRGMGHPAQKCLERMLKNGGTYNKMVHDKLTKIQESCGACLENAKAKPRPKVAPPTAYDVGECLSLDLKIYNKWGKIILYIEDEFSRYMVAESIPSKQAEVVVKAFLDRWIMGTPYGAPFQIKTDNGGEFINGSMRDLCEMYNIKHLTTGAFSAFQNGGNERNHATVDHMLEKILHGREDIKFEDALAQAVHAKNSLLNVHGFSPSQILAGKQPRMPGACQDNRPPADNTEVSSRTVQDNLNLRQKTRDAWTKVDNSNRLSRAMKAQESHLVKYNTGDTVYYKFGMDPNWHGPGKIVGQDNKVVFIRHGGRVIVSSQSRLYKPKEQVYREVTSPAAASAPTITASQGDKTSSDNSSSDDQRSSDSSDTEPDSEGEASQRVEPPQATEENQQLGRDKDNSDGRDSPERNRDIERFGFRPDQIQAANEAEEKEESEDEESGDEMKKDKEERVKRRVRRNLTKVKWPQKGNWILYKEKDKNVWFRAQVRGKGTKASSKVPYYNITPEFDNDMGVNLDNYDWTYDSPESNKEKIIFAGPAEKRKKTPTSTGSREKKKKGKKNQQEENSQSPKLRSRRENEENVNTYLTYFTYTDQISRAEEAEKNDPAFVVFIPKDKWDKPFVREAKEKELANFRSYGAYKEVRDEGQRRMSSQWILTEKLYGKILGAKARLVVHGNQEKKNMEMMSDSPTVSKQTLRIQFALAAQFGWEIVMADITSAFLQSDIIDREIYVQPPKDAAPPGVIWLLQKPMYGLEDASLQWYKTLADRLKKLGCIKLITDPATFYWLDKDQRLGGIISWHVDDMIACGSDIFYQKVLKKLMKTFNFGSTAEGKYRCLGWNVLHKQGDILVSQQDYIETKIDFLDINKGKNKGYEKLGFEDAKKTRGMIGKLRWLADQCRPEICYNQLELSIAAHSPTYDTVKLINKMVAQVKFRNYDIRYSKLNSKQWYITVFADASLRGLPDKVSSAMGYVIFLSEGYRFRERTGCNVLSWKACKTRRIVASTYDAETLALSTALEEAIFIKHQFTKMLGIGEEDILIEAFCDCKDTVSAIIANKPLPNSKSRLASLEIARIKEMKDLKMIESIHWLDTTQQLGDVFTKRGASTEAIIQTIEKGKFFN